MLVLLATAACDGDGTGPARPASMVAITATTQRVPVATAVPVPPTVLVSDHRGRALSGVEVTFAITSGNGAVAAKALTDAGGMAVASGWTTGTAAVENVLTASVPDVTPVTFRVTALPGPATSVEKAGGDAQTAGAGSVLADSISVRVLDAHGNGVPDVPVAFTTTAGTLSATTRLTGAEGHARVSLTLPIRPGSVQVRASSGILTQQSFAVTVTAAAPASIVRLEGEGQAAPTGMAVQIAPAVRVTDRYGNAVPGRTVTFTPAAGSGTVTGGTVATSPDGRAAVGRWVLGDTGTNRLVARVAGLDSLVFTATSMAPCGSRTYTLLSTITDVLRAGRCRIGSRNAEVYTFTVATAQCLEFRMSSSQFDAYLYLLNNVGVILSQNDDSGGGLNSLIRMQLAPGSYALAAAGFSEGTGSFVLSSAVAASGSCGSFVSPAPSAGKASR
jgi:adhesin/invasin